MADLSDTSLQDTSLLRDTSFNGSETSPASTTPYLLTAPRPDADLASWVRECRTLVDPLLREHGALLFRGFRVPAAEDFQAFAQAASDGPLLEYQDRSTPRYEVGARVYVSTTYPANEAIHLHNEGTYWRTWPLKIAFCCLEPSATGGETPIADVRKVYAAVDPDIRELFRERQVMYVRNYHPGIGLTWQDAFQTTDPRAVEAYGARGGIQIEWRADGRLRTRQIRPAIRLHPRTGEPVWFNHAAFFHVSSLRPRVRDALLEAFGEEELPYHTYFGDGGPIDPDIVAHLREAYVAQKVTFTWRAHDVLLLDNMSVAHGREPYTGTRKVIVAMTDAHSEA